MIVVQLIWLGNPLSERSAFSGIAVFAPVPNDRYEVRRDLPIKREAESLWVMKIAGISIRG